jgi:hypothetical protein
MRLVPLVGFVLLLASGPVFAQQNALTPDQADCPPGEPDSLQISWNQPCDSGEWLFDTQAGCRMWDWHPAPEDAVVWRGACHDHLPNGQGEAQWFEHGRPIDRFIGTFRNGKRDGEGHYIWNQNVRFDGNYANDLPQGYGIARIENEVLAGKWDKGCISTGGKVVAIGVPRTSCGPDSGKRLEKVAGRRASDSAGMFSSRTGWPRAAPSPGATLSGHPLVKHHDTDAGFFCPPPLSS